VYIWRCVHMTLNIKCVDMTCTTRIVGRTLISIIIYIVPAVTYMSFNLTTSLTGDPLCVLDDPFKKFYVDPSVPGPPQCARVCSRDIYCNSFNYICSEMRCDAFYIVQLNFSNVPGCYHYNVLQVVPNPYCTLYLVCLNKLPKFTYKRILLD